CSSKLRQERREKLAERRFEVVRLRRLNIYAVVLTIFKLGFNPNGKKRNGVESVICCLNIHGLKPLVTHNLLFVTLDPPAFALIPILQDGATAGRYLSYLLLALHNYINQIIKLISSAYKKY
ncbi:MAG: hypothetical protein DRP93_05830, partial [Candidatus Neomarinimicrobiota bacterium]